MKIGRISEAFKNANFLLRQMAPKKLFRKTVFLPEKQVIFKRKKGYTDSIVLRVLNS
jgi:hypothetical protein